MRGSLRVWALLSLIVALLLAAAPIAPVAAPAVRPSPHIVAAPAALAPAAPSPTPSEAPSPSPVVSQPVQTPTEVPSTPIPTATAIPRVATLYRITIPRLGISLLIKEGDITRDIDDQHTPENYAFHLPGTVMPGQGGNTYLYAHARTGMFLSLWNARPGDEVFIAAPDGRLFAYVIREVFPRVEPTDVSSTTPTASERLTLQTSTGPGPSDPRFVVFAFPRGG